MSHKYRPTPDVERFIQTSLLGKNTPFRAVAFEGPAGCGKTACAEYIHAQRKLPESKFLPLMLSGQTSVEDLLQERTSEAGTVVVRDKEFLKLIQEPSTILLDEYKAAPAEVLLVLNSLLDHRKYWVSADGTMYKRHPENIIILSSNPEGYAGVKRQHGGFIDRLPTLQFGYSKEEGDILTEAYPNVGEESIVRMLKFAQLVRESMAKKGTETIMSTRGLLMMGQLVDNGASLEEAYRFTLKIPAEEVQAINVMADLAFGSTLSKNEKTGKTELDLLSGFEKKLKEKDNEVGDLKKQLKTAVEAKEQFVSAIRKAAEAHKAKVEAEKAKK